MAEPDTSGQNKTCFVVMGFGKKTDFQSKPPRTLDLDMSYQHLIKPAVEEAGLECIRADEIRHAGIIDVPMYEQLLSADLVLADLSTYNPNAFYELGVRHALRPFTTVVIAEEKLHYPYDVNHTVIRPYKHLGEDIGYGEVMRFKKDLKEALGEILAAQKTDSPVYTYLHDLNPPALGEAEAAPDELEATSTRSAMDDAAIANPSIAALLAQVAKARRKKEFATARDLLRALLALKQGDDYLRQQLALATYKAGEIEDSEDKTVAALVEARAILMQLDPLTSADPETLGLWGAVHKRLWEKTKGRPHLDEAIRGLERGFYMKSDYYNGINLAFMLHSRATVSKGDDAIADRVLADRVRRRVIEICKEQVEQAEAAGEQPEYWLLATLEEAWHGLGNAAQEKNWQQRAKAAVTENWMRDSTLEQLEKLDELLAQGSA